MSTVVQDLHGGRRALPAGDTRRSDIDSNVDCESDLKKNRLLLLFVKSEKLFAKKNCHDTLGFVSIWKTHTLTAGRSAVVAKTLRCRLGRSAVHG